MKFLQLTKNNKPLKVPKILELGHGLTADFNTITFDTEFDQIVLVDTQPHRSYQKTDGRNYDYELQIVEQYNIICNLSDCYQSRPLIEIGQWCEFDLLEDSLDSEIRLLTVSTNKIATLDQMNKTGVVLHNWWLNPTTQEIKNIGSIFTKENQKKYPKLLKKALGLIN